MKDKLIKKFVDRMMAFVNTKGVTAIKDGIVCWLHLSYLGQSSSSSSSNDVRN